MGAWMAEIERVDSVVGRCWIQLERVGRPKVGAWQLFAREIYPAVVWTVGSLNSKVFPWVWVSETGWWHVLG
ncbi:hypothetical protein V6N12_057081 [Hibiscus sabdariffa]|uniref:Uncharacterized protein n=1 Tax=Hibiscus sabdariffa TaxID=183260 RepID=A0ABR2DCX7_9ROSI